MLSLVKGQSVMVSGGRVGVVEKVVLDGRAVEVYFKSHLEYKWFSILSIVPTQGDGIYTCEKCGMPLVQTDEDTVCSAGCVIEPYNKIPLGR